MLARRGSIEERRRGAVDGGVEGGGCRGGNESEW